MNKRIADEVLRPSYGAAAVVTAAILFLYVLTLGSTTALWDTSEYIAASYILGLPHPPGNPLFIIIGRVFSLLPIAPTVAQRINLLAAIASAVTAGIWFLVTERVLAAWFVEKWQRWTGGAVAALLAATQFTVWNQSVVNEKVYTVSLFFFAIVAWLTVRWCDEPDAPRSDRLLVLIAFLLGLGYAVHPAGLLVAPAVATAILARKATVLLKWRLLLAGALVFGLGLTPFAYEPIRAAHRPVINEGDPTGCVNGIGWKCTFSKTTYERLRDNIERKQFAKPPLSARQAPFSAQLGMYWLYFRWQWLRDIKVTAPGTQSVLAALFFVLGLAGGYVHWKHDRRSFWFYGPLVFTVTLVLVYYMNFKYGASQAPELGETVPREVRDRDYFYLWSFSAWGVWAALGLVGIWRLVAEMIHRREGAPSDIPRRDWLLAAPVLAFALIPLVGNWRAASHRGETFARDFAHDLLNSVEPYGILITGGDNDTFPLGYAQEVEGVRRDVTVAVTSLLNTDWYIRSLVNRPLPDYDAAKGPAIYRDRQWKKPTKPLVAMSREELDALPEVMVVTQPMAFRAGGIDATINPKDLSHDAGTAYLERTDVLVLRMIADSAPDRAVYVSRGAGSYGAQLGLRPYIVMQGLVNRIGYEVGKAGRDTVAVSGVGLVDLKRTLALWDDYKVPGAIIKRRLWTDPASISLPLMYANTGQILAVGLHTRGDTVEAEKIFARAQAIGAALGLDTR